MAEIAYPLALPHPQITRVKGSEKRLLTEGSGPRDSRTVQRDELDDQQLSFFFSAIQMVIFEAWLKDDLIYGRAWFSATWLFPTGFAALVRKFIGKFGRDYIGGGYWRVTARVQVRGRGMTPATPVVSDCYLENFNDGLAPYDITGGGVFSIISSTYGDALKVTGGAITAFQSTADRDITPFICTSTSFKVRVDSFPAGTNPDDGPVLELRSVGATVLLFDCQREAAFDAARRPYVQFDGSLVSAAPAALAVGAWHSATLEIVSPTTAEFTLRVVGGAVLQVTTFTGSFSTLTVDQIRVYDAFSFGGSDVKCSATYDEIELCP